MDCKHCAYCNRCKHPNENKPACLMKTRYDKAVVMARVPKRYRNSSQPIPYTGRIQRDTESN